MCLEPGQKMEIQNKTSDKMGGQRWLGTSCRLTSVKNLVKVLWGRNGEGSPQLPGPPQASSSGEGRVKASHHLKGGGPGPQVRDNRENWLHLALLQGLTLMRSWDECLQVPAGLVAGCGPNSPEGSQGTRRPNLVLHWDV